MKIRYQSEISGSAKIMRVVQPVIPGVVLPTILDTGTAFIYTYPITHKRVSHQTFELANAMIEEFITIAAKNLGIKVPE